MRIFKIVFLTVFFQSCLAQPVQQEPYLKHTVVKGENVFQIAKKYQVTPYDIYRLNPDVKEGVQENAVLLIPTKHTQVEQTEDVVPTIIYHKAEAKETLFNLAKQYNVSVADLEEWNPDVKENGLKEGQTIIVSKTTKSVLKDVEVVSEVKTTTSVATHIVQPQETVFGLSKQYNISEEELLALNPQLKDGLKTGDTIKVKKVNQIDVVRVNNNENLYTVKPQETIFGITKQFSISEEELMALNPELKDGLKDGMVLKLPKAVSTIFDVKPTTNLVATLDYNTPKELVLLLPFNLSKIQSDTLNSSKDYIKKSKLLNVALDFYSGAKVAIDSVKKMGLPVKIKVINVESGKYSSNVADIIKNNNFSQTDAVIGPFTNANVETTATLLKEYNIPVISPLSKELSKPIGNLYNAVPTEDDLLAALFQYINSKDGNTVAIISGKKESTKTMLKSKYPQVKYPELGEKGSFTEANIKAQLVKGKKNFVILETEKSGQIVSITNILMKLKTEFDIQLVAFEVYDSFNYEEVKMENLTALQLLYPSVTKEPTTLEDKVVIRKLRDANQVTPNYYTTKGFDVTFDTLLRICQPEGFATTTQEYATEGVENSFSYVVKDGVNINNKIYLQYYDTDFTIKTAQ